MSETYYGTRWGRAGFLSGAALLAVGGMAFGMANGAFGASYIATSSKGGLAVDGLRTDHVAAVVRPMDVKAPDGTVYQDYVASFMIGTGFANGVCLTEKTTMLGQTITLMIHAGDQDPSTEEIALDGLVLNVFDADAFLQTLGDTYVSKNPLDIAIEGTPSMTGLQPGEFGLEAGGVVLKHAVATVQDGELVRLPPGVRVQAEMLVGDHDCPSPG